ncbi:DoxX family protein [Kribbella deserti]|uniref:DoxX family protein n=1 Tax=Kribbella deserti TaxID=1926257 RepID=A0ABV6QXD2_9ACTN
MYEAYQIVAVLTILANAVIAILDFCKANFVLQNSAAVDVPESWIPWLAALKAAGATGLLLGLLGVPYVGTAAAVGLVVFFIGAVLTHIRAKAISTIGAPVAYLALAVATLTLGLV